MGSATVPKIESGQDTSRTNWLPHMQIHRKINTISVHFKMEIKKMCCYNFAL